jgi:hypothetical protein
VRLSEAQAAILRFLHERFPTPYRDTVEGVKPRSKYQPPTQREALATLGIAPATWDDSIAFLTAHELVREVYRHGTEEYSAITLTPGRVVRVPVARDSPPPDADPADERYGIHCYQITARGIQVLENLAAPHLRNHSESFGPMSPPAPPAAAISLFYSYSHKDEALRKKLETHLSLLQDQGIISGWHDRRIAAGTEWDGAISQNLEEAGVILLLVSADFLASRYCRDVEIKRAMERHEAGTARVIPVILRSVDWHTAPFGQLQALPTDGKPVTSWKNRDEAFTDVARGLREAVKSLTSGARHPPAPAPPAPVVTPPVASPRAVDRAALVRTVSGLSPSDLAQLVMLVEGAASHVSRHGTVPEQVAELVRWAESPTGPGLGTIEEAAEGLGFLP